VLQAYKMGSDSSFIFEMRAVQARDVFPFHCEPTPEVWRGQLREAVLRREPVLQVYTMGSDTRLIFGMRVVQARDVFPLHSEPVSEVYTNRSERS
jgi:hypothetical protein